MATTAFDIELDDLTLARARSGDIAACGVLYTLYHPSAYNIALRVCHCPQLAQDVTQDAFISAFRRIRQYRGDAPFWGWLRRVVVNHAISALRHSSHLNLADSDDLQTDRQASHEGDTARIALAMDLEEAFSRLDGEDRAVVWLHDVEGYNHKEIADLFGKTESFSKTRLSRAHARLREWIHPSLQPEPSGGKRGQPEADVSIAATTATEANPLSMFSLSSAF